MSPRAKKKLRLVVERQAPREGRLPEYDRRDAPAHLLTRRQLRARGLSPGGHEPVAVLRCRGCAARPDLACTHPTRAWLYDARLAREKRVSTLAQEWALDRAMAARQTCPQCRRRYHYCLPLRTQGVCDPCARSYDPTPGTFLPAPVATSLAA
ncbi:RRQRL motif-containing zinc-binding protein [Streptomyces sp. NPDC001255]|uniref:RRQRL motif-containing zinc-binding protein n=1 Tax=Streptomyces sp. NPDC001255 TaxID=3364550 RepID=UPI0036C63BEC